MGTMKEQQYKTALFVHLILDGLVDSVLLCVTDCVQVVPMAGMVRDVTVAVIVYMALHVIMSLESAPAVRDGRDSLATVVSD